MKKLLFPLAGGLLVLLNSCSSSQKTNPGIPGQSTGMQLPAFNKEGHRGTRGLMPENTIPSMYTAIDHNVNIVEVDVVISRDNKVAISHDVYFHPDITTTPDGRNLDSREAQRHLLFEMDYDSIGTYDVGLKPHKDF